jgi:hypothetical protein
MGRNAKRKADRQHKVPFHYHQAIGAKEAVNTKYTKHNLTPEERELWDTAAAADLLRFADVPPCIENPSFVRRPFVVDGISEVECLRKMRQMPPDWEPVFFVITASPRGRLLVPVCADELHKLDRYIQGREKQIVISPDNTIRHASHESLADLLDGGER